MLHAVVASGVAFFAAPRCACVLFFRSRNIDMSPIGHSLVGLAFAAIALPVFHDYKWRLGLPILFVALANLPDWPIPNWGHGRYDISHSIFVNLALITLVLLLWRVVPRLNSSFSLRCVLLGAAAWLSHLVLDSFYNHGRGVAIYWPFSDGRLNLSMPWFSTVDLSQSALSQQNLSVYTIEFAAYLPVLIMAVLVGRKQRVKNKEGQNKGDAAQ
jgi:hypothetical protein